MSGAIDVNFFDKSTNDCPYDTYRVLRDDAPVWKDPVTGMYVITRYDDVRAILLDQVRFTNEASGAKTHESVMPEDPEKARELLELIAKDREIQELYEREGWPPVATLDALDEPKHLECRRLFDRAFRPKKIAEIDPYVEELAYRLIDSFLDRSRCEVVRDYAVPLPLFVIGRQVGVPEDDMPRIKKWTEAYVQRLGLMQTPEERLWSAEQEIEFQQYFKPIIDRLREEPDETLLSELVNRPVPEWGRTLTDAELLSELMIDLMVGGTETTTNALSAGILFLIERRDIWDEILRDRERLLPRFVEEVLRLESPVQGLLRQARVDVELHGVTIPTGAMVNLRYAAANRDERQFDKPTELDLDRRRPQRHLAFGVGTHHCLGAPLARRELFFGFKAFLDRVSEAWLIEGANDFSYLSSYFLRGIKELHIGFRATSSA